MARGVASSISLRRERARHHRQHQHDHTASVRRRDAIKHFLRLSEQQLLVLLEQCLARRAFRQFAARRRRGRHPSASGARRRRVTSRRAAAEYAPDQRMPLVGGYVMLRLVNPSLLTPVASRCAPPTRPRGADGGGGRCAGGVRSATSRTDAERRRAAQSDADHENSPKPLKQRAVWLQGAVHGAAQLVHRRQRRQGAPIVVVVVVVVVVVIACAATR